MKLGNILKTSLLAGTVALSAISCLSSSNYMQRGIDENNRWMIQNAPNYTSEPIFKPEYSTIEPSPEPTPSEK